ncbi:acyltransferase family protein [Yersinia enterocolitica]|uniref:acyltransferase family protein n=1 Tax=Yersinia enterocolitica TaxID=630 RepID=UPI003CFC6902
MLSTDSSFKNEYRPDIDGLRAIAVIAVILYHFKLFGITGGFVGVDVFFVISGYLITKGILSLAETGRFSYSGFYIRRARRLLPALIVTIVLSYAVSAFIFSPVDFALMSSSSIFSMLCVSNIYFWLSYGYFDADSSIKPLLHTWSLSVEMQFYLLWPFLVMLFATKAKSFVFHFIALFIILMSAVSIIYLKHDSSGAFFLTPFRMHEFAIGAVVLYFERFKRPLLVDNIIYIVGLTLILYCVLSYNSQSMSFPGHAALVPTAGAAMMILSGGNANLSVIASNKIMRFIGEISYSLYLVHWPVFVFAQYIYGTSLGVFSRATLILITLIISIIMYFLVEKPFRNKKTIKVSDSGFYKYCSALSALIVSVSFFSWHGNGWDWRINSSIREATTIDMKAATNYIWDNQVKYRNRKEFNGASNTEKLYIIGDSQSADIVNILTESKDIEKYDVIAMTIDSGCGVPYVEISNRDNFLKNINRKTSSSPDVVKNCLIQMNEVINDKIINDSDKIFIAMRWEDYSQPFLQEMINKMKEKTHAEIYIFGRKTMEKGSVDIVNAFGRTYGVEHFASSFKSTYTDKVNADVKNIQGAKFIDMMSISCPSSDRCLVLANGKPIYVDPSHLSKDGAKLFGSDLRKLLN